MAHLTILRTYAQRVDPTTLPPSVKLCHTDFSVTIFDKYPKSRYHFVLIPFIRPPLRVADLRDLRSVLQLPREQAKAVLQNARRDALEAKALVEEEMIRENGFKWGVQMGFHAVPSLEYVPVPLKHLQHIHLHIMSTDFVGENMMAKKHFNSFHPTLGFFLHIDEILSWFEPDVEPTWFAMKSDINQKEYMKLIKADMMCSHCEKEFKTIPKLRQHLEDILKKMEQDHKQRTAAESTESADGAEVARTGTKRKHGASEDVDQVTDPDARDADEQPTKRRETEAATDSSPQES